MARDLERVRLASRQTSQDLAKTSAKRGEKAPAAPEPTSKPEPTQPKPISTPREERKLSDILTEARRRVSAAPAKKEEAAPSPGKTLEELLPIEPLDFARGKPLDTVYAEPSRSAPGKPLDTVYAEPSRSAPGKLSPDLPKTEIIKKPVPENNITTSRQGVPPNLPVGEPIFAVPETVTPYIEKIPSVSEVTDKSTKRTPEEILGLSPQKIPPIPSTSLGTSPPTSLGTSPPTSLPSEAGPPTTTLATLGPPKKRPDIKIPRIKSIPALKFILIMVISGIVVLASAYGIYWKIFPREAPESPTPPAPKITEQPVPESLIEFDEREIIEIKSLNYDSLKPKIDSLRGAGFLPESLVYIPIKYVSEGEARYLTLSEIFQTLQIDAPPALNDYKNFTLYLYSAGAEAERLCRDAKILNESCYGPRIGIVIELSSPEEGALTRETALGIMTEWEKTIIDDLRPLMLANPQRPAGYTPGDNFAKGKYRDFDTHFINLPISTTSVDWLLLNQYLIIATSKEAANSAVDNLK